MNEVNRPNNLSTQTITKNTIYNLLGIGLPVLVAIGSIPLLIERMGTERFGLLSLCWVIIGYFSIFDLGLGRALTRIIAEKRALNHKQDIAELASTTTTVILLLGFTGAAVLFLTAPWIANTVMRLPDALREEALHSMYILSVSIPVLTLSASLKGIMEAYERFDLVNAIRLPLGLITFLGPLFVVFTYSNRLVDVVGLLVAVRFGFLMVQYLLCRRLNAQMLNPSHIRFRRIREVLHFAGWMTVSNVLSPMMVYMDRLLMGGLTSIAAVAYYATPYEMVTKILMIPSALSSVLFPAFSGMKGHQADRIGPLYLRGVTAAMLAMFPVILTVVTFAHGIMEIWLNVEFADQSYRVMQILAMGVFLNGIANIPYALVQGLGRPDLTAKAHLAEIIGYLPICCMLILNFGAVGAAIAWLLRVGTDLMLLQGFVLRLAGPVEGIRSFYITLFILLGFFTLFMLELHSGVKVSLYILILMIYAVMVIPYVRKARRIPANEGATG
ncbi:flippase [Paenibacillus swuensis]|uniref:flippase n=1 Tax=Paenibacillus swuensis TaxID=1178515 RepID=UPI000838D373|nr:flippase [Paenibacillus swuensis]